MIINSPQWRPKKETIMVLKVDLDCPRCFKKVKKLLCQFPQIHDQIYNEKQNTVMIKVICCSPEKIRDKLCCKGGKSIKSIEILQPKKPPPPPPPPAKPKDPEPAPEQPKPEPAPQKPARVPVPQPSPIQCYPVHQVNPVNTGCQCPECYEGRTTGPCYHGHGYGVPPPPPPPPAGGWCYYSDCCPPAPPSGGYGDYNYDKYKPGYCVTRCGDYISDENPTACVIM